MTGAHDHVLRWRGGDIARWSLCAAMIVALHIGAAAYMVTRAPGAPPGGLPTAAVMEMLPEVSAPPAPTTEAPPGPEMQKTEDLPEKLAEKPEEEAMPEEPVKAAEPEPEVPPAPLAPKPEVAVAPREPEPPAEAKQVEKKPIEAPKRPEQKKKVVQKPKQPATTAPPPSQTARAQSAPLALAPSVPSNAMPAWNQSIAAMLKRNLQFPPDAMRRGVRGSAQVSLSIGRDGNLISARLISSAGDSQLDQEAVAVVRRTAPFPAPPDGRATSRIVPIRFDLK